MFLQFLVDILALGSGSVDPHIFADPDPGSQNLADPTNPDPDPKHCLKLRYLCFFTNRQNYIKNHDINITTFLMFLTIFLCVQYTLYIAKEKFRDIFMNVLVLIVFCFTESRIKFSSFEMVKLLDFCFRKLEKSEVLGCAS